MRLRCLHDKSRRKLQIITYKILVQTKSRTPTNDLLASLITLDATEFPFDLFVQLAGGLSRQSAQ